MVWTDPSSSPRASLCFGRFELQFNHRRLLIDGQPALLGGRALDLLMVLAEKPGELVTKTDLLDRVWPGLVVEEGNIAVQVNALRRVLGGDLIGTVPGRGYRLTTHVDGMVVRASPAPAPALGRQTHLPRALPALLGRTNDLAALDALVGAHGLVTVTGAGGIGKSLLVQHFLDSRRNAPAHGVCWVELGGIAVVAALPATIAAALGVRLGAGDPLDALAQAVGPLDLLLALDSAEHLADAVGNLATRLLDAAPRLRLVVTSQVRLGVATERVQRLAPLDLPHADADAEQAMASGAVALFLERAKAADPRFCLTDTNAAALAAVCRAVDGLPLAIELAAARVPILGIHGLARSMGDQMRLLTRNRNREAPARQQTLRATLEWSHGLLDAAEQIVFRRLAVVVGSCSLQMAQQVAADEGGDGSVDAWGVLDALDVLVDRSLVAVLSGDDDVRPRYRLLESPRAFAQERLAAAGEVDATQLRLVAAVVALFAHEWDTYYSDKNVSFGRFLQALALDLDNARSAVAFANCPASSRLQIAAHLQRALPSALLAERLALADVCEVLLEAEPSLELRMFGWLSTSWTWMNTRRQRSRAVVDRAVSLARDHGRSTGDRGYLYTALALSAYTKAVNYDLDAASAALAEMETLEGETKVPRHIIGRHDAGAVVAGVRGDHVECLRLARERVAESQDVEVDVFGLTNLMNAELATGDAQAAAATGRTLVAGLLSSRDEFHLTLTRLNLCAALLALDAREEARPVAEAGWSTAARFELEAPWADYLALLAALEHRPSAAARLSGFSIAAYAAIDEPREINEAAAFDRACRLSVSALGSAEFERLQFEGRVLRTADVASIAFE